MQSFLGIFNRSVERRAVLAGALVSTTATLVIGVGIGSLIEERTVGAYAVNGALLVSWVVAGAVAACRASQHRLLAAVLSSGPVMVLSAVVLGIRRFAFGEDLAPLALPLAMLLAASLATLGGVLWGMRRQRHRSLLD